MKVYYLFQIIMYFSLGNGFLTKNKLHLLHLGPNYLHRIRKNGLPLHFAPSNPSTFFSQFCTTKYSKSVFFSSAKIPDEKSIKNIKPKNNNQKLYCQYLKDSNIKIVVGVGPAGSGKTLFACDTAIKELYKKNVNKIIITRPLISVDDENIGFLPGSITEKMDPWTRPIIDIFQEYIPLNEIKSLISSGKIEIAPLAYMRGRTFKNAIIIADEMQNSSPNQMLMITTRIGEGSKLIITGDLNQTDRDGLNGLSDFINKVNKYYSKNFDSTSFLTFSQERSVGENEFCGNEVDAKCKVEPKIAILKFEKTDIERSPVVSTIMNIYEKFDTPATANWSSSTLHTEKSLNFDSTSFSQNNTFLDCDLEKWVPNKNFTEKIIDSNFSTLYPENIILPTLRSGENFILPPQATENWSSSTFCSDESLNISNKGSEDASLFPKNYFTKNFIKRI